MTRQFPWEPFIAVFLKDRYMYFCFQAHRQKRPDGMRALLPGGGKMLCGLPDAGNGVKEYARVERGNVESSRS